MPRLLEHFNFPKVVTVFAITFGIALGACGLTVLAANTRGTAADYFLPLGILELLAMLFSAAGLVLTAIVWVVVTVIGDRGGGAPGTTKLFDQSDQNNREP